MNLKIFISIKPQHILTYFYINISGRGIHGHLFKGLCIWGYKLFLLVRKACKVAIGVILNSIWKNLMQLDISTFKLTFFSHMHLLIKWNKLWRDLDSMTFLIFEFLNMVLHIVMIIYNYIYTCSTKWSIGLYFSSFMYLSFVFEMYIAV